MIYMYLRFRLSYGKITCVYPYNMVTSFYVGGPLVLRLISTIVGATLQKTLP